jgi:hypothetical protein
MKVQALAVVPRVPALVGRAVVRVAGVNAVADAVAVGVARGLRASPGEVPGSRPGLSRGIESKNPRAGRTGKRASPSNTGRRARR